MLDDMPIFIGFDQTMKNPEASYKTATTAIFIAFDQEYMAKKLRLIFIKSCNAGFGGVVFIGRLLIKSLFFNGGRHRD